MTKLFMVTLLLVSINASANNCSSLNNFDWLLGKWQTENAQTLTTEIWHKISKNTFEGTGQTANNLETLRLLAMSGDIFYLAKVSHNLVPIAFKLIECKDKSFTFANHQHDFPNKIEYRRINNKVIQITVSGQEGKSFTIQLHRQANEYK